METKGVQAQVDQPDMAGRSGLRHRQGSSVAGVGAVVALALAAAVLLLRPATTVTRFAPDSPEGVLQVYLEARDAGDSLAAWGLLSARAKREVPFDRFSEYASYRWMWRDEQGGDPLVTLDRVRASGDRVTLELTVTHVGDPGLFDLGRHSYQERVPLVREPEGWRIDDPWLSL